MVSPREDGERMREGEGITDTLLPSGGQVVHGAGEIRVCWIFPMCSLLDSPSVFPFSQAKAYKLLKRRLKNWKVSLICGPLGRSSRREFILGFLF